MLLELKKLMLAGTKDVPISFKMQNESLPITADLSFKLVLPLEKFIIYNEIF